jgi:hypothetical protein
VKHIRSALSLLGLCLMTAMGAAFAFALIIAGGAVALASHQDSVLQNSGASQKNLSPSQAPLGPSSVAATFSGMITDSYCGARHRRGSHQSSAECARACVRKGATYVLVDGDHRYQLTGANEVLDKLVGQRANVMGAREGSAISVTSADPVALH